MSLSMRKCHRSTIWWNKILWQSLMTGLWGSFSNALWQRFSASLKRECSWHFLAKQSNTWGSSSLYSSSKRRTSSGLLLSSNNEVMNSSDIFQLRLPSPPPPNHHSQHVQSKNFKNYFKTKKKDFKKLIKNLVWLSSWPVSLEIPYPSIQGQLVKTKCQSLETKSAWKEH